ncbi:MAG: hypothetical protein H0T84_00305 [Tatlockia sp.]|nr:hypothetical protein [Tatlockia sp.]
MKKIGFFLGSALLLAACSQFASNGDKQYLNSKNGARVVVPPPMTDSNISRFYDLPPQNQNAGVSIRPSAAGASPKFTTKRRAL